MLELDFSQRLGDLELDICADLPVQGVLPLSSVCLGQVNLIN